MRRPSLGRGLNQLISGTALAQSRAVIEVAPERLRPNPFQPRQTTDPESLSQLAESIRVQGILQPLLVRPAGDDYEIVLGERRWQAAQQAGIETVPCIVQEIDDSKALQLALIENLHREDLNCLETARGYQQLMEDFAFTHEELSRQIGKSRSAITNTLRLLQLPQEVQLSLVEGRLSEGHGRALLTLASLPEQLLRIWRTVEQEGLSVRETEQLARIAAAEEESGKKAARARPAPVQDPHLTEVAERLQVALAAEVSIRTKPGAGGAISIHYSDDEELERLIEILAPGEFL